MRARKKYLLVVEDDQGLQSQLRWCFDGFAVEVAADREEAIAQLRRIRPSVVTLDLGLPPDPGGVSEGLATLEEIIALMPETKVIVVTGNDDRPNALRAIELGAYDFYPKPIDADTLRLVVERAHRLFELEAENRRFQNAEASMPLPGIVATSAKMLDACHKLEMVADTNVTILILGESGTGKELFARALHERSGRSAGRLVALNCAAIPEHLLESELFGYEKGAFTGAVKQTRGKIEYADGGTLFLDEIGDLPQALQAKLLRFLQERTIERIGGREEIPIDVRIVCATHQDLEAQIAEGRFREDLYYRLCELAILLPPLREREGDTLVLARTFLNKYNREIGKSIRGFSKDALAAIEAYDWPGNVREIQSRVRRAVILAQQHLLSPEDLDLTRPDEETALPVSLQTVRDEAEIHAIRRAITLAEGRIAKAAQLLGVTRPTLYSLLKKHNLKGLVDAVSSK